MNKISIHAPVKGATDDTGAVPILELISIHAPVKGATRYLFSVVVPLLFDFNPRTREGCDYGSTTRRQKRMYNFNPRTREGCDVRQLQARTQGHAISIHAPVKGATPSQKRLITALLVFQSTHP